MKMIESAYETEILDTGFIRKDDMAKARRRQSVIEASDAENKLHEFNPGPAKWNDNPGGCGEEM